MYDKLAKHWYVYVVNTTSWFDISDKPSTQITYPADRHGPFTYAGAEQFAFAQPLAHISYEPE